VRTQSAAPADRRIRYAGRILALLTIMVFAFFFTQPADVHADDGSSLDEAFTTESLDVKITAHENNSYDVDETFDVDFSNARHGIYRYIPRNRDYWVHDVSVDGDPYDVYTLDDNTVIKIGDKKKTVRGRKTYRIHYQISFVSDRDGSKDLMFLDVVPASWRTNIDRVNVTIDCPDSVTWTKITTYSGKYGSKTDSYGEWTQDRKQHRLSFTAEGLPHHTGVTIRAELPNGTWKHVPLASPKSWALLAILIACAGAIVILRFFVRREKKQQVVMTVEFYPPDGMSAAEIGFVADDQCDPDDITSLLLELAADGCVRIEEVPVGYGGAEVSRSVRKRGRDYLFIKTGEPGDDPLKKRYFRLLFGSAEADANGRTQVTLSSLEKKIGSGYDEIAQAINKEFDAKSEKALYSRSSSIRHTVLFIIYGAGIFLTEFLFGVRNGWIESVMIAFGAAAMPCVFAVFLEWFLKLRKSDSRKNAAGALVGGLFFLGLYLLFIPLLTNQELPRWLLVLLLIYTFACIPPLLTSRVRTAYGASLYGRTIGFKNFLKTAEADRLQVLLKEDPYYYDRMMPYAYVFGLLDEWEKKFRGLGVKEPDWYTAAGGATFGAAAAGLSGAFNSIASDIASEVRETSSTFGGDGGSGGGGGGGGGGSW
jgi:hypothetical protein